MRNIIGSVFQSLDGVMQSPGRPEEDRSGGFTLGGWLGAFTDATTSDALRAILLGAPYDLLLGRKTYDLFAAYWPFQSDENPIAARFNAATKYFLSSKPAQLDWPTACRLDSIAAVAELKATAGPDLLIQGSSTLYSQLLQAGLLDQVTIHTFPLLLGRGKRLFSAETPTAGLQLVQHVVSQMGVIIATYTPTGQPLALASEPPNPSAAEIARREQVLREGAEG